jgi:hypothetical protein
MTTWKAPPHIDRESERRRLTRLSLELSKRKGTACETIPPTGRLLELVTGADRQRLTSDLESISRERIIANFPADEAGRLDLDTTVLVRTYKTTEPPGKDRDVCLSVVGPAKRRDPQGLRVELLDLIVVNQSHRWDQCRWLWTAEPVPPTYLWGAAPGDTIEEGRAYESLQLLDQGKIEEALLLYGVSISADLHLLLGGQEIAPPACCAKPSQAWTDLLIKTFRESAPWLLPAAVTSEVERLNTWRAEKKGRTKRLPELKFVIFPGQFHARKASLVLMGDLDGKNPRFVIEATASNSRIHDTAWKRPHAVDFERYGVSVPTAIDPT